MAAEAWVDMSIEIDGRANPTIWTNPAESEWVRIDETNKMRRLSIRRKGARKPWLRPDPSELVLTLGNDNGFLDPSYAGGPYASLLTRRRQLRLVYLPTAKTFFHGLVQRWPVRWTKDGHDATTVLLVLDRLSELGNLPPSLVEYELNRGVRYPRPLAYWPLRERVIGPDRRMTEARGYTPGANIIGGPPRAAGEQLVPYSDIEGIKIQANNSAQGPRVHDLSASFPFPSTDFTLAAVVKAEEGGSAFLTDADAGLNGVNLGIRLQSNVTPQINSYQCAVGSSSGAIRIQSGISGDDSLPHLMAMTSSWPGTGDATLRLFTDLVYFGGVLYSSRKAMEFPLYFGIGRGGAVALVMLWNSALTHSTGAMHLTKLHEDIFKPGVGDTGQSRVLRILDIAAPGAPRNIATWSTSLVPFNPLSRPTLDLLANKAIDANARIWAAIHDSAGGEQYGKIRFSGGKTAVLRTYGVGGVPVMDMAIEDSAVAFGSVKVTNEVGNEWTVGDPANGEQLTISDSTLEGTALQNLAQRQLDASVAEAVPAVSSMTINPHRADVGFADTLALDLYDRVNVGYQQPWLASPTTELREICDLDHDFDTTNGWITTAYYRKPAA